MNNVGVKRATYIGLCALFMWAIEPLFVSEVNSLPIFELLTIIFFSSFLFTAARITYTKRWSLVLRQPMFVWVAGVMGICSSDFAYIFGSKYAPIAHVELIDYLWPSFAILFTSMLPKERFSWRYMMGALLGFVGIYCLVHSEIFAEQFNSNYILGYSLALIGAAIWGSYCAFSRHHHHLPTEMVGLYCGIGAVICFMLHLKFEMFVLPSFKEGSVAVLTGITGAGLAYQLWDYGIKHGNVYLLGVLTYGARLAGMAMLVAFGKEPLSVNLIVACILATLGVLISTMDISLINPAKWFHYMRYNKALKQPSTTTCGYCGLSTDLTAPCCPSP